MALNFHHTSCYQPVQALASGSGPKTADTVTVSQSFASSISQLSENALTILNQTFLAFCSKHGTIRCAVCNVLNPYYMSHWSPEIIELIRSHGLWHCAYTFSNTSCPARHELFQDIMLPPEPSFRMDILNIIKLKQQELPQASEATHVKRLLLWFPEGTRCHN